MTELDTDVDESTESAPEPQPKLTLDVKIAEPSACQRHVTVTVSREDIDRYTGKAFDDIRAKAEVPGFRVGRAPRKLVESRFREQVSEQVKGSLLMDCLTQINEDFQFTAISEPDFDFEAVAIPEDGPMTFEFNIEVRPEFAMPVWQGLSLERPVHDYTATDVDRQMTQLLSRFGALTPIDGPAKADDVVIVNVTSRLGDQIMAEARELEIRVKPILSFGDARLESFDQLMVGAKSSDRRTAKVKMSGDAEAEAVRDQDLDVEFEVLDVKRLELPEMNRAFLEKIGGFANEEEVRAAVKVELEHQLTYHQQRRVRQQITALLTASATWELPQTMLRKQAKRELDRAVMELRSSGFSNDAIQAHANELRQNSLASTATALKEHFILERIAEDEKVEVEPGDYDEEVKLIAAQSDESPRRVRARLEKRGMMDSLRNQIVERKVIKLIESHAQFKQVPFEQKPNNTVAVEFSLGGKLEEADIPEAKHGGAAEPLPQQHERH